MDVIGAKIWVIPEGYIPGSGTGPPELQSHETACVLNAGDHDATLEITVYFTDREPVGPYVVTVGARRTAHVRLDHLEDPAPVPRDEPYACIVRSDVPVVVQHTRLDSRQAENALMTTMAYPVRG